MVRRALCWVLGTQRGAGRPNPSPPELTGGELLLQVRQRAHSLPAQKTHVIQVLPLSLATGSPRAEPSEGSGLRVSILPASLQAGWSVGAGSCDAVGWQVGGQIQGADWAAEDKFPAADTPPPPTGGVKTPQAPLPGGTHRPLPLSAFLFLAPKATYPLPSPLRFVN